MIPPRQVTARLTDKIVHNEKFTQYYFELTEPPQAEFIAGQYASIKVSPEGHRRAYSICSSPSKTHGFELLVDVTPAGVGTKLLGGLQFGDEISALYPLGLFTLSTEPEEALIFLATGSGIAPLRSMILDQLQNKHDTRPMILYWGLRHTEQLFWQDEFQELSDAFPNFQFHPVLSQAIPEWTLCRGRVTDCLTIHQQPANAGFYLCGNPGMITDVQSILLSQNVPPARIHMEKFIH